MSILSKNLIGSTVVLMPKGNAVKRGSSPVEQAFEAVVSDLKRVKVSFTRLDGKDVGQFRLNGSHRNYVNNDYNSGYYVFLNWDEFHIYRKSEAAKFRLAESIKSLTSAGSFPISPEQYIQIAELLGWSDITGINTQTN